MNIRTFTTALIAIAAAATYALPALAQEGNDPQPANFASTLTRAEVQAAAVQARADGLITTGEQSVVIAAKGMSLSRAQVRAETLEAIRVGAIPQGEHTVFPTAQQLDLIRMAGQRALTMTLAAR